MNIYLVVEGERASRKIYKEWIPLVNNKLRYVDYLTEVDNDNFFILAGFGQPYFLERVEKGVLDVNNMHIFDRLVIAVDSEGINPLDKQIEISKRVDKIGCRVEVRYIIQHICLETWLCGNKNMFRKNTIDSELRSYLELFDIRNNDPVQLPDNPAKSWNKAQFAYEYLRAGIRDVYSRQQAPMYSKRNPGLVTQAGYFNQIRDRCINRNHILNFRNLLDAFV